MSPDKQEILNSLKSFDEIADEWKLNGASPELARLLTLRQVIAFENIVNDDACRDFLLKKFNNGRASDSWLATDWQNGFDELILCAPLCKLVDWQCEECMIGKHQQNHSCEDENSVFGWTAELLKETDKEKLLIHIGRLKRMLEDSNTKWNLKTHSINE